MKLLQRQNGVALILELLLVAAIAVAGTLVFMNWQQANQKVKEAETNTVKKEQQKTDESASWLLYEPSSQEFKIRLADGWNALVTDPESEEIVVYNNSDFIYKPGTKATVRVVEGGRGGPFPFHILLNRAFDVRRGTSQGAFKTNSGIEGTKYYFVQESDDEGIVHDLRKGEKEYTYYFKKGVTTIAITYAIYGDAEDQLAIVEKAIKTLEIK